MGVEWIVVCKDCKRRIDLYKNQAVPALWYNQTAGGLSGIGREPYSMELVETFCFMRRHWGHRVDLAGSEGDDYGYLFASYQDERPVQSGTDTTDV